MRTPSKTVLVVEDDNDIREMMSEFLCAEGYAILEAHDGRTALDILNKNTPDIALLDVMLPDISGFEICRMLKNNENTKDTEVIFISGRNTLSDKLTGFLAGGKRYICKPFLMEELLDYIYYLVGSHREKRELASLLLEEYA